MYFHSPEFHDVTKVMIDAGAPSNYVIRTQPLEGCLSTVEAAALVLSHVEGRGEIYSQLTRPMETLCQFQLQHGAAKHHSKEYLVVHGMYDKPVPKEIKRRIREKNQTEDTRENNSNGGHEREGKTVEIIGRTETEVIS